MPIYPISVVPPDLYLILWPAVAAVIKEMMENVSGMYSPPAMALMIYSPTIVSLSNEEAGRSYGTARDTHVHTQVHTLTPAHTYSHTYKHTT